MAKQNDVINLAHAALSGDRERTVQACRMIMAGEPPRSTLKDRLERLLRNAPATRPIELLPRALQGLVLPLEPKLALADTTLPHQVQQELALFLEEQSHTETLHAHGLSVPHKILLSGPPGNGKTTLAGAIAKELNLPFFVLDFSEVVSSHLGESGAKIAKVFRGIVEKPAVLFLDEMETVLAERAGTGNSSDVGEMKRIVSTLLLEIDRLPDHIILIGATNHEEMLDRAVVRRFDFHWTLPAPDDGMVKRWLHRFAEQYPHIPVLAEMPAIAEGTTSLSDLERQVLIWCRRWVVSTQTKR